MTERNVVLLVDNKQRDLLAVTLIAHHLRQRGVLCHLEPLEAYQGCLAAYRPDMIIFNHLTASHLAAYSRRLRDMGVLTAVLTNEGITYEKDLLKFIVGSHHSDSHVDYFLCWNGEMKQAMIEMGFDRKTRIEVVGIPRFDFYCRPWSRMFEEDRRGPARKPRVLVCTNFAFADYHGVPEAAEVFFAALKDRLPIFKNYHELIEVHYQNRLRVFPFLDALAAKGLWEVIVRPHPYEKIDVYQAWLDQLPANQRAGVRLDKDSNITALILNSELQLSCETCTTAMEGWIAGKPTIELTFQKHPVFFHEEHASRQPLCERADEVADAVAEALAHPDQPAYQAGRREHLKKWCHTPDGNSSELVAEVVAKAVREKSPADWSKLTVTDQRRAAKLRLVQTIGKAYHYDPLLDLKAVLWKKKYAVKDFTYRKSIQPRDVAEARGQLAACLAADQNQTHDSSRG